MPSIITKRHFLRGLLATPAVVAFSSIMPVRIPLVWRKRLIYVRVDGSDANDGLTDSPVGAFRTIQHAANFFMENPFSGETTIVIGSEEYYDDKCAGWKDVHTTTITW